MPNKSFKLTGMLKGRQSHSSLDPECVTQKGFFSGTLVVLQYGCS